MSEQNSSKKITLNTDGAGAQNPTTSTSIRLIQTKVRIDSDKGRTERPKVPSQRLHDKGVRGMNYTHNLTMLLPLPFRTVGKQQIRVR
jgi:hypothetical protein